MTLNDFLIKQKITTQQFAKNMRVSFSAVSKWRLPTKNPERRNPRRAMIERITKATNGKVTLKDWTV